MVVNIMVLAISFQQRSRNNYALLEAQVLLTSAHSILEQNTDLG